ncbi:MAG: UDP-glucose 4-epimerase GalE [Actinobacteria bacterium HGW-Actinobacteria-4]|nr:MAG: UDP-glucose 4-epimerase GalE [Actinobacteria bacterium HGW-Actinobacteria-4]
MTWLVTGGAGYIGAHVVRAFQSAGIDAVILDDFSSGVGSFVPEDVPLVTASVLDTGAVAAALRDHSIVGVVHCAAFKYAGESVKRPVHTYRQNVEGTGTLLDAMQQEGVVNLVFSSSAGVFGTPPEALVTETTPTAPESPYGESKLAAEWLIRGQVRATAAGDAPLRATSLRYFNVVGSGFDDIYDASPHNLFPKVFASIARGEAPVIAGTDYPTADGTCVRDYIHVSDLAHSHVVAAQRLVAGESIEPVYNLGSGAGTSVREIMNAIVDVTGTDLTPVDGDRRPGDPASIVATGELAARDLDWQMRYTVRDMVASAWRADPGHGRI